MQSVNQNLPSEQADTMLLPRKQSVIKQEPIAGWTMGPLPDQRLEQLAWKLFTFDRGSVPAWDQVFPSTRDDYRRFVLQLRVEFLTLDAWTIENGSEKLSEELGGLLFGERRLGPTLREELRDYCDSFLADAWGYFSKKLFYPNDVAKNEAELEAEDNRRG